MKKILILASNPKGTATLDLDRELRELREGLRRSPNRDEFKIETREAVRPSDLRRAMLEVQPQIVHFCGHGTGVQGLILEDEDGQERLASTEALSDLFRIFSNQVECVLLNACYSKEQAQSIVHHINYVIGMSREVQDDAAISFTIGFYDAMGAGESVERAFEVGRNAVLFEACERKPKYRKLLLVNDESEVAESLKDFAPILLKKEGLIVVQENPKAARNEQQEMSASQSHGTSETGSHASASSQNDPSNLASSPGSQSMVNNLGNVTFGSGNNAFSFQPTIAGRDIEITSNLSQGVAEQQDFLKALQVLKQAIQNTEQLHPLMKTGAEAEVQKIESEVQKAEVDKNLIAQTVSALKQGLQGIQDLAGPVAAVASLAAKAWGVPVL